MNREPSQRYEYERHQYLDETKDRYFFDVDSGIYKPKSYQTETGREQQTPGASNRSPLFFNAIPDSFTLTIGLFSLCTLFVTFLAVVWYASVAEQQRLEMHNAT